MQDDYETDFAEVPAGYHIAGEDDDDDDLGEDILLKKKADDDEDEFDFDDTPLDDEAEIESEFY